MSMMLLPSSHLLPPPDDESRNQIANPDKFLVKKETLFQQEKQISVDPISVKESAPVPKFNGMSLLSLPLPPSKTKFLSTSLPGSATSSPMLKKKKKSKNQCHPSPSHIDPLSRQHSLALTRLNQLRENHLRRSKSCGEGRATTPSDEFDMWFKVNNGVSFRRNEVKTSENHGQDKIREPSVDCVDRGYEENFKCGALCLFLPGFGRGKLVRPRKEEIEKDVEKEMGHVISRTVSLEKFECGSWTSSAIIMDNVGIGHEEDSGQLFYDLPLELIRNSVNDSDSPVTAAFVFGDKERKGVLKTSTSTNTARKSHEASSRHVRFSTSSPRSNPTSPTSCITPRLRKAREDFNAFLEAQSV